MELDRPVPSKSSARSYNLSVDSPMSNRSMAKREAILEAATELFLTREYAGTSMEDIAVAAAVSKQTVYKHFNDKETLFREVALGSVGPVAAHSRQRC